MAASGFPDASFLKGEPASATLSEKVSCYSILFLLVFALHFSQNTASYQMCEARHPTRRDEPTLAVSDVIRSHSSRHSFIHGLIMGYMTITLTGSG